MRKKTLKLDHMVPNIASSASKKRLLKLTLGEGIQMKKKALKLTQRLDHMVPDPESGSSLIFDPSIKK